MTDPMELVGRAEHFDGAHKRGCELRSWSCTCGDDETAMNLIAQMAACIREVVEKREGLEEDLYQAVLVAYRRGAVEWTMLNYPQWINAISAGREVCPPAPGAEA